MQFDPPLQPATLIKRYKRFFADARLPDGSIMTMHCPNTGSMQGCNMPDKQIWYSTSSNQHRKLPYTWELIEVAPQVRVGINTHRANHLVQEAIEQGVIVQLQGYGAIRREVPYGDEKSRIDFLLEFSDRSCFVEVKNVTLAEIPEALSSGNGECTEEILGYFPDAVTTRGQKHLRELAQVCQQGARAVLIFCVQHTGIDRVLAAAHIDPDYAQALQQAMEQGVEVLAYKAQLSPEAIALYREIPVQ